MKNLTKIDIEQPMRRALVRATDSILPDKVLDNAALEKMVDTSDQWITMRTGIKQRRIISDGESTATLAISAAKTTLQKAHLQGEDLDLIICTTITPEMVFPATACFVQEALDNNSCCAFDLTAACCGYIYGITIATMMISARQANNALILGAETLSTITNYKDRSSCILFGDGAGAVLLEAEENTTRGVLYSRLHADGSGWEALSCQAYGSRHPVSRELDDENKVYMRINGRETYQLAVRRIVEIVEEVYQTCGICNDNITIVIPHQMNLRIIESAAKRLHLSADKIFVNIDKYGNTSAASIAIALDEAMRDRHLKEGDLIILVAFGAGRTWGVNLIRL